MFLWNLDVLILKVQFERLEVILDSTFPPSSAEILKERDYYNGFRRKDAKLQKRRIISTIERFKPIGFCFTFVSHFGTLIRVIKSSTSLVLPFTAVLNDLTKLKYIFYLLTS